jgi:hypothetical protein
MKRSTLQLVWGATGPGELVIDAQCPTSRPLKKPIDAAAVVADD